MKQRTFPMMPVLCGVLATCTIWTSGCRVLAMPVDRMLFKSQVTKSEEENEAMRAELEQLKAQYAESTEQIKKDIETSKQEVEALIAAKEIGPALARIKSMNNEFNGGVTKRQKLTEKEGLRPTDYLQDASARTLAVVDDVMGSGEFQKLDKWLAERYSLPADEATLDGFKAKHEDLYKQWVVFLKKESARTSQSHPGSSLLYALKAHALANEIEDKAAVNELGSMIKNLKAQLVRDHAFEFAVTSASGSDADSVVKALRSTSWSGKIQQASSKSSRTHATASMSLGAPSYKASKSEKQDSFKYQSGTQQVPNPEIDSVQREIDSAQSEVERYQELVSDAERKYKDNSDMARCEAGGRVQSCQNARESAQSDIERYSGYVQDNQEELAEAQSKLASLPKTVSEPVYDQYYYPVTVHHLDGSRACEVVVKPVSGGQTFRDSKKVTVSLSDEEHAAHSKNDGSVSADPADPPSKSSALKSLNQSATVKLKLVVEQAFDAHREAMLASLPKEKEARINALMIYVFLEPGAASESAVIELEELAQVSEIVKLMK